MIGGILSRRLFWRVYLTLLVSLIAVALAIGLLWRFVQDREGRGPIAFESRVINALLPPPGADATETQLALSRLADAMGGEVTLTGPHGVVVARAGAEPTGYVPRFQVSLGHGRMLEVSARPREGPPRPGLLFLVAVAVGVGVAAYPVVSRLTRRLETLRHSVDRWGGGDLSYRVAVRGGDEVASVGASFNRAADRVEELLAAHKTLLAHASHELRSPLARLRLAIELFGDNPSAAAKSAIESDIAELDGLVDEILLASRLDRADQPQIIEPVDLVALAAEEAARTGATLLDGPSDIVLDGSAPLLRRLIRNLLENAAKHGKPPVEIGVGPGPVLFVQDRGPGIPAAETERVFEPFHRPAGVTEAAGSWGLGLALVRQIAERHKGKVTVSNREGGGARFTVTFASS